MGSRKIEWLKRSITLLVSTVLTVALGEVFFRIYEAEFLSGQLKFGANTVDLAGMNFNDTRIRRRLGSGEFRVLSLGDSFAYSTVKYPYSHHAVAANKLNALGLGKRVRIVNLGEPAISFYQYMNRYKFWSEMIEHDAALFNVYLGNDIIEVSLGHTPDRVGLNRGFLNVAYNTQTGLPRMRVPNKYGLRILDYSVAFYKIWKGDLTPQKSSRGEKYMVVTSDLSEDAYYANALSQVDNFDVRRLKGLRRGYEALIHFLRMVSEIRKGGKQVAVFLSPNETQANPELRTELVRRFNVDFDQLDLGLSAYLVKEALQRIDSEIPLLDLHAAFLHGEESGHDLYLGTTTHWSADGDELAGRCLAVFLARRWFNRDPHRFEEACPVGDEKVIPEAVRHGRNRVLREFLLPLLGEAQAPSVSLPPVPLAGLARIPGKTTFSLSTVNGVRFDPLSVSKTIPRSPEFSVSGWAFDPHANAVAGGVVVEINGEDFAAEYGLSRSDVAQRFDDWKLHAVGFSLVLPAARYPSAPTLILRVKIISNDRRGYYQSGPVEFRLE